MLQLPQCQFFGTGRAGFGCTDVVAEVLGIEIWVPEDGQNVHMLMTESMRGIWSI